MISDVPTISVVVSTYNRCALLGEAIESIFEQKEPLPSFELILVDNNSSDGTRAVVDGLVARFGPRLRYVFEGRQGLSHGRNAGIAHARAPLIAFTDDDVRVAPDWLRAMVRAFDEHPDASFVGGKVLPRWPSPPPEWLTKEHWAPLALSDAGDAPMVIDRSHPRCLVGASLGVRRSMFSRFGGFEPAFQHNGRVSSVEDHEFQLRLWRAGFKGLYDPTVVVTADVQPDRMTKAYHRKWHRDHGTIEPYIYQPGEAIDPKFGLVTRPAAWTLFGVPAWSLRFAVTSILAFVATTARGREAAALMHENAFRENIGSMLAHWRRRKIAGRPIVESMPPVEA
jgi:glycosyltransferase involved in cell wall biosynthesis